MNAKGLEMVYPNNGMLVSPREQDQRERREDERQAAHQRLHDTLINAVKSGSDLIVPRPGWKGDLWPVSVYLGECGSNAQALLLKACAEAMRGGDAGKALRAFVEAVANDYADDHVDSVVED
jgi:hypothetical protein